ncbi:AMP-binding protein [Desulfopila inferna]|uniref:AMP-binding protein n=1 Tax=Desulfopila inferna TaxID=468528 RepID=UPI001965DB95|nr:AMP-binding protein [Desulfopila inferna]MBM9605566.1 AMP-binding protein [Desulfopila inferna]
MVEGTEVRMTLNYIIDSSCDKYGDEPAIGMAMTAPLSYREFHGRILSLAAKMMREGVKKGDHVAILAENSHNWGTVYLAVVRTGAIAVPILPDLPEADVHHILNEMKVKLLFTTQRQIDKVYELKQKLKGPIITLDDYVGISGVLEITKFSDYLEEAEKQFEEHAGKDATQFPSVEEDDIASILYTSGTSGYSKAVMLSHKNLTSNAYAASGLAELKVGHVFLSILPISHTYEFTCGFILPLIKGCRIAYAGKTPTPAILQKLCQHERPDVIFAVPLVLEKIYKKRIVAKIEGSKALKLFCRMGLGQKIIYKRIGKKLLEFFGGKLMFMGVGGAALNPDVEKFLVTAGFPYLIGYGLTESAPLLAGGPLGDPTIVPGSTGKPIPGVEITIKDPDPQTGIGEICGCGPNIMKGYYDDEEGTAEVISKDGWLSTGDLGFLDDAGNLYIRGRSKNVIVMSNGENVYPETIEHKINGYGWVVEALVVENNGQLDAWIYPDYELIDEQTADQARSKRQEYVDKLMEDMRKELNSQLSTASRISKIFERREPFIKTATHKIKRYLYDGQSMVP